MKKTLSKLKLNKEFWYMNIADKVFLFFGFWFVALFTLIISKYIKPLLPIIPLADAANSALSQGAITPQTAPIIGQVVLEIQKFLLKAIPTIIVGLLGLFALHALAKSYGWSVIKGKKFTFNYFKKYYLLTLVWFFLWFVFTFSPLFIFNEVTGLIISIMIFVLFLHSHSHIFYSFDDSSPLESIKSGLKRAFSARGILSSIIVMPLLLFGIIIVQVLKTISIPLFLLGISIFSFIVSYSKLIIYHITYRT